MKQSVILSVADRPDLTHDIGLEAGRALHRIVNRVKNLHSDAHCEVISSCGASVRFFAGSIRNAESYRDLIDWLETRSEESGYHTPTERFAVLAETLCAFVAEDQLPHIYLDLDGLFANFDLDYSKDFDHHHSVVDKETLWLHARGTPQWYRGLTLVPHSQLFYFAIRHLPHTFLSSSGSQEIAEDKAWWIDNVLNAAPDRKFTAVLPCDEGAFDKTVFLKNPGDILIDDYDQNTAKWTAAGGVGIAHNDFESTCEQLLAALSSSVSR